MSINRANELLYDSAAALRIVDKELDELRTVAPDANGSVAEGDASDARECSCGGSGPAVAATPVDGALGTVPDILRRASDEIAKMLTQLRSSRVALEEATADRLQQTHDKIREVTSATEVAATGILDGLDRAQLLLDEMDTDAEPTPTLRGADLRQQLRDEIFSLMGCMQFQDITTQQLNYAGSILLELEQRLSDVQHLFEAREIEASAIPQSSSAMVFAPDASLDKSEIRQALADEIFTGGK